MYLIMTVSISHFLLGFAVFLLLQNIRAGNRKKISRSNQLLPDRKKLSQRYLQNVNNFVLVVFDQLF
jgi:hypothetical protein